MVADLWSNESVRYQAPRGHGADRFVRAACLRLPYAQRRQHKRQSTALLLLCDICADSDSKLDLQAYVLRPDVVFDISKKLVEIEGYYKRTKAAGLLALEAMREGSEAGLLMLSDREKVWLDNLTEQIEALPEDEARICPRDAAGV